MIIISNISNTNETNLFAVMSGKQVGHLRILSVLCGKKINQLMDVKITSRLPELL